MNKDGKDQVRSAAYDAAAAFIEKMKTGAEKTAPMFQDEIGVKASASPEEPHENSHSHNETPQPAKAEKPAEQTASPSQKTVDVDGGGHDNNHGGHGGKGGGSGGGKGESSGKSEEDEPFFTRTEKKFLMYFVGFIIGSLVLVYVTKYVTDLITPSGYNQQSVVSTNQVKPTVETKPSVVPSVVPSKPNEVTPSMVKSEILHPNSFSCENEETKESGFAKAKTYTFGEGQSLQIDSGCLLVQTNVKVTKLDGVKYHISIPVSNNLSDGFYPCGNGIPSGKDNIMRNDTPETCINFINSHSGQTMYISVRNGGHLNLN